jgi:hypothetical protein
MGNELLAAFHAGADRDDATARFAFAVPTDEALDAIVAVSPGGVVELGAGTGYWAYLLHDRGIDVVAYDADPPPSPTNPWFAGSEPWFPVQPGTEEAVEQHSARTLLLVWPTRNEDWPAAAAERFHRAGGRTLVYVGEPPGGATGDDRLQALLGGLDDCVPCRYGVLDAPCVCGTPHLWRAERVVPLPHWPGRSDDLVVHRRDDRARAISARPRRR